jgi:hypothetical protein
MWKTLAVGVVLAALVPSRAAALENEDLLALVAMPLAVAAVSEVTDVPEAQLIDVITLLNDAEVSPPQFIEVVRYVPVALVVEVDDQPGFVEFVRLRRQDGLAGPALVTSIEQRIRLAGVPDVELEVTAPRFVDVDARFIPQSVRTRIAEVKAHPHGGPPGQLKKLAGVKTGAAIVHDDDDDRRRGRRDTTVGDDRNVTRRQGKKDDDGDHKGRGRKHDRDDDDRGKGHGKGKGRGKG